MDRRGKLIGVVLVFLLSAVALFLALRTEPQIVIEAGLQVEPLNELADVPDSLQDVELREDSNSIEPVDQSNPNTKSLLAPLVLDEKNKEIILTCTQNVGSMGGVSQKRDFATLDEYLKKAPRPRGGAALRIQTQVQNIHIRKADGEQLRLRASTNPARVQIFKVDSENLPVIADLPERIRALNPSEAVAMFLTWGEKTFEEVSQTLQFDEETSAQIVRKQGHVTELQLFLRSGFLGCSTGQADAISCICNLEK